MKHSSNVGLVNHSLCNLVKLKYLNKLHYIERIFQQYSSLPWNESLIFLARQFYFLDKKFGKNLIMIWVFFLQLFTLEYFFQ
jgi:hypothetical protein